MYLATFSDRPLSGLESMPGMSPLEKNRLSSQLIQINFFWD
jgi:hypothetical protein